MDQSQKIKEYMKVYRNLPEVKLRARELQILNREKRNEKERIRRSKNRKYYNLKNQELRKDVNKKEKYNQKAREYKKENSASVNENNMRRYQFKKLGSICLKQHKKEIEKIYQECLKICEITQIKHNVDHIIPLVNENVCGLHVPWNLQILTKEENQRKMNCFDGTNDNDSWREKCNYLT